MKVFVITECTSSFQNEATGVNEQFIFVDYTDAMQKYEEMLNSYRQDPNGDEWVETMYSDHCSHFYCDGDETEIYLHEMNL